MDWNPEPLKNAVYLVVTDLDGSLLDHHSYRYDPAKPMLELLEEMRIPVILASSKTRVEMLALREEMGNEHPFIVENGAAVLIPKGYFRSQPQGSEDRDGYWVRELVPPRSRWTEPLEGLRQALPGAFQDFATAGVDGIVAMTGLRSEDAARANQREYTEPVQWRGSEEDLAHFIEKLTSCGARVLRGGRFYSVGGDSTKGDALNWLRRQFALAAGEAAVYDLAIGDGQNDVPMLEVAHHALLIPAPDRPLPELVRKANVIVGVGEGPDAWAWGVREWLRGLYQGTEQAPEEV